MSRRGWQRHHVIPRAIASGDRYPDIGCMLDDAGRHAPGLLQATIPLPGTERLAEASGLPLHRGPHPRYDDWVAGRLALALPLYARDGRAPLGFLRGLQNGLVASLHGGRWGARLSDRRPLEVQPGHARLDDLVHALGASLFEPAE